MVSPGLTVSREGQVIGNTANHFLARCLRVRLDSEAWGHRRYAKGGDQMPHGWILDWGAMTGCC